MNWLKLIAPALQVLRQGQELRNPAAWKNAQVVANVLSAVVALAVAAGYDFGISDAHISGIAGGIVAAINIYTTIATSQKVGFRQKSPATELPPIDLIARADGTYDRVRVQPVALPPIAPDQSTSAEASDTNGNGWNG